MERTLILLRVSLAALFFWFGFQQWLHPSMWIAFLPTWTGYIPAPPNIFIMINGCIELIGAIALLIGIWVRPISVFFGLHLLLIAISVGDAIGVRDAALAASAFALALSPADRYTIDAKFPPSSNQN